MSRRIHFQASCTVELLTDKISADDAAAAAVAGDCSLEKLWQRWPDALLPSPGTAEPGTEPAVAAARIRIAVVERAVERLAADSFVAGADKFGFLIAGCLASGDGVVGVVSVEVVVEEEAGPPVEQRSLDLDSMSRRSVRRVSELRTWLDW